jgi:hypothetical protein
MTDTSTGHDISMATYRNHNTGVMENPMYEKPECEKPEAA